MTKNVNFVSTHLGLPYFIIVIMYLKKEGTASRPNLFITTDIFIK
jgi:hypothetical protein